MTSEHHNRLRAERLEELRYFDRLSPALREAVRNAPQSVRAKTVFDAFIRGVTEKQLIETLKGKKNE